MYNERSFCVKYRSQGVQTSLGNTIPPGDIEDPGNARADFPLCFRGTQSQKYLQTLQGSIQTHSCYARHLEGGVQL